MALHPTGKNLQKIFSSIGFSGAGFLACYHLGVVDCLREHGLLSHENKTVPRLVGVSGGALVAASVAGNVSSEDGMQIILNVNRQTRKLGPYLDALQPGFSLIDTMEPEFSSVLEKAVDKVGHETFLRRIGNGNLQIGLTDRRVFPPVGDNPSAFFIVDSYQDVQDVVAACILSSYIPALTGPVLGNRHTKNRAVNRASKRLYDMIRRGCVKHSVSGEPLLWDGDVSDDREICWDGGLVNAFPTIDKDTVVVSPIAGNFVNPSISPALEYKEAPRSIPIDPFVEMHLTTANAWALKFMGLSSDDSVLEGKFQQGYDNATEFLEQNNLIEVAQQVV